jgi:ribose transport system ATP-binding protein
MNAPAVEMIGISKTFPGVVALKDVSFGVERGEVHALVGENGAGKSTLMKVLGGIYMRDSGQIKLRGKLVEIGSPRKAIELGISIIHQELMLVPEMSIAQNLFLGRSLRTVGVLNSRKMNEATREILARFEIDIDPKTPMRRLGIAMQQMVEIAKAVSLNSEILVMDEPTATLTTQETEQLFSLINRLRTDGVSIIYISHRLEEIFRIADRTTVLRDGSTVETLGPEEMNPARIIKLMVGRDIDQLFVKTNVPTSEEALRIEGLSSDKVRDISLRISKGEILGVAGLMGSGRTEMARAIIGVDPVTSGAIFLNGRKVRISNPREAIRNGIGYLSEDRKKHGIIPDMSVASNIAIAVLKRLSTAGVLNLKGKRTLAEGFRRRLSIRSPSIQVLIKNLSGGNQQKVLIARWLATEVPVLIFDEPTRGIDVGAKHEVYMLMSDLARQGLAVMMISSELREILAMSDRIVVMYNGRIAGELTPETATQEKILHLATGGK